MGNDETYVDRIERELRAFVALLRRNRLLGIAVGILAVGYALHLGGFLPTDKSHDRENLTSEISKHDQEDPAIEKPMDFYLKWNTVIPGPLLKQYRFSDADYNSCMQACENNPKCVAWDFGPVPLPIGVKYNCGLKFAVTGTRVYQADIVSGYSSRYQPPTQ